MTFRSLVLRRLCLGVPTVALAALVAVLSWRVVSGIAHGALDWLLACLFAIVMAWESMVVVQVTLGFLSWLRGRKALSDLERRADAVDPRPTGRSRTAIAIPVFDEDVAAVSRLVESMRQSLLRLGPGTDVDIHILSDSRESASLADEAASFSGREAGPAPAVHYRHRRTNEGHKAGNIAEFLRRTRGRYDFMIVLDADSLMSGRAIRVLIRLMEESPRVGLIQTISYATGRDTLFARVQQFAVRLHAHLSLKGMAFWQGADGLYYGHNAIIRCEPFLAHAELPVLPGRPPLGGEILCHDVVEAALLRRAGWEVRVLPDLEGTWEEMPTNLVDLLGRERRWCQGNLQHIRVVPWPGLTAGSRFHICTGIGGYLVGPLWWAFLIGGAVRALTSAHGAGLGVLAYGATEPGGAATGLFWLGMVFLFWPRLLNVLHALCGRRERRAYGGGAKLVASALLEQLFSVLLTPTLSLVTIRFVATTFAGRVVQWRSQSRADRDVLWGEAVRLLWPNLVLGAFFLAAAVTAGGWYAVWALPTAIGLLSGPALAVWSSRRSLGRWTLRRGLFLTVDDTRPADELRWAAEMPPPVDRTRAA